MKKNLSQEEQLMRIGFGGLMLAYGLVRKNRGWLIGILPLTTGILKFCPVKNALSTMLDLQNKAAYASSEMNKTTIDGEDGSGGYRTGNPATGSTTGTYSSGTITES
jgi:hypothetical protein